MSKIIAVLLFVLLFANCGDDGRNGKDGKQGLQGQPGDNGVVYGVGTPGKNGLNAPNCQVSCADKHLAVIECPTSVISFKVKECKENKNGRD